MSTANADPTAEGVTWHAMAADEAERRLTTDIEKGLDAGEASRRLQKYGPNRLPEGKKRGPFRRFLSQFNNILVYVLLGAGFVKLMFNAPLAGAVFVLEELVRRFELHIAVAALGASAAAIAVARMFLGDAPERRA